MHGKFLFALAACLPLALSGCGGGGGSSSPAEQSPSGGSGTQTPAAALNAAKTAVDNANSAKTEAAVQRARGALSEAVEKAEAALAAARADLKEAQDYSGAQAAILDDLPIRDLAAAETASATLALEARGALDTAKTAMARARNLRTEAAIQRARRALSEAVEKAQASLASMTAIVRDAEADLKEAQDYRDEQSTILDSIPFTRLPAPLPLSSPPGEFRVTHVERSFAYLKENIAIPGSDPYVGVCLIEGFDSGRCVDGEVELDVVLFGDDLYTTPRYSRHNQISVIFVWGSTTQLRTEERLRPVESYWQSIRDDARDLENGFSLFDGLSSGSRVNGIKIARKNFLGTFPPSYVGNREAYDRYVVGIGSYGAFEILSAFVEAPIEPCLTTAGSPPRSASGRLSLRDGYARRALRLGSSIAARWRGSSIRNRERLSPAQRN